MTLPEGVVLVTHVFEAILVRPGRDDREFIADLELAVFASGIPPVRLQLTKEPGIGEDAADVLDRLDQLREAGK